MDKKLVEILSKAGKDTEVFCSSDGSEVLILPYGGRILGVFSSDSQKNFYWTNPALEHVDSSKTFFNSDQWHNSGGYRTWLAPEVDLFFPKFPELSEYFQPRQLDPGNYQVVRNNDRIGLVNDFSVKLSRSKAQIDLKLTKSVGPALNPLRYERGLDELTGVTYAGYTLYASLQMLGNSEETGTVGLWNLVQMPHGGDLLIPTYSRTEPRIYFGQVCAEDLLVEDRFITYKMRAQGEHKIGLRAIATTGRVGYIYGSEENTALIIRNFIVNPSGEYIDVPWKDTEYKGFSTQACNVNSQLGSFSELEYHIPAVGKNTGKRRCEDVAQIWAFRGKKEIIITIARTLLNQQI